MTLVDDLKAARALIDTPEKWVQITEILTVLVRAVGDHAGFVAERILPMCDALDAQSPIAPAACIVRPYVWLCESPMSTHADVMRLFDRAIDAATLSQQKEASK